MRLDLVARIVARKMRHFQHVNNAAWVAVAPINELMQDMVEVLTPTTPSGLPLASQTQVRWEAQILSTPIAQTCLRTWAVKSRCPPCEVYELQK